MISICSELVLMSLTSTDTASAVVDDYFVIEYRFATARNTFSIFLKTNGRKKLVEQQLAGRWRQDFWWMR